MKSSRNSHPILTTALVLGCLALPLAHGAIIAKPADVAAAKGKTAASSGTNSVAGTNAANVPLVIPLSVFDIVLAPVKDPFFPNTLRHPRTEKGNAKAIVGVSANSLQLMALSGPPDSRLAMINHRTLGVGEAVEVMTSSGKVTIRLLQFKENSVVVRVVTPPQPDLIELSLSKRAQ